MGEMIMRPCGGSWEYCDGDCCHCEKANLTTSNSTTSTKTNADHIRSMTDEELAKLLLDPVDEKVCPNGCDGCDGDCDGKMLNWLKQPYKEGA